MDYMYGTLRYFLGFLLVAMSHMGAAQGVSFEHITQNDGLPSPTVTAVFKDSYGFMWFGTRRGLVRYDGYSYTVFDKIPSETGALISNFFFRKIVQLDDTTLLMVHNSKGFYAFNLNTEKFTLILNTSAGVDWDKANYIYSLRVDKSGLIWLATAHGLMCYDRKKNSFVNMPFTNFPETTVRDTPLAVTSLVEADGHIIWMFCVNGYVAKFDVGDKTFTYIKYSHNPIASLVLNHGGKVLLDKHNTLWIGTEYEGIYTYDTKSFAIVHYSKENGMLPSNAIMDFCEDHQGGIWVGTDGGGLLRFNRSSNSFECFKNNPLEPTSISGNAIYAVTESDDGNLWVGTYAAGLNIYKCNKEKFQKLSDKGVFGARLSYKSVLAFAEAPDGSVLIGTDGGGLNVFNPKTNTLIYYTSANSVLHADVVNTLYFDRKGYLWVGSYGKGFARYAFHNGLQRKSKIYLDGKGVWKIVQDGKGNIWAGSLNQIYSLPLDPKGEPMGEPILRLSAPFGITNDMIVDSKDQVWVGTSSLGLGRFDRHTFAFQHIVADQHKKDALPRNNVTSIYQDREGQYWVGTEFGGLARLIDFEKNKVEVMSQIDPLFRSVNGILEDKTKNLWLATDNGIVQFKNKREFVPFTVEDGIQNKEFNVAAALGLKSGTLLMGGPEGFNYFQPAGIQYNTAVPPVFITDIKLFNKPLALGVSVQGKVYLSKPAYLSEEITLPYSDNVFSIGFAALDFKSPEQNKYKYQLEGFDQKWFTTDARNRYATYTNLPPGDYTFHVMGANNDGYWNPKAAQLMIHILPPWWMTLWFRALMIVLGLSLMLSIYLWRVYAIKKKNVELKILVNVKTAELKSINETLVETNDMMLIANENLEAQNLEVIRKSDRIMEQQSEIVAQNVELNKLNDTKDKFFSIIAHDLKNPVTVLHALSDLLVQNYKSYSDQEKEQYLQSILQSSSHLKKLTVDLLDWAASQTRHYTIDKVALNLNQLVHKTFEVLSTQAMQKNILLSNHTHASHIVWADERMLATVIRNLVSNSIKYSTDGAVVSVYSSLIASEALKITVEDSGVGMTEQQLDELFRLDVISSTHGTQNEGGIGLGLVICKDFVLQNDGHLEVESKIAEGTKVHIFLSGYVSEQADHTDSSTADEKEGVVEFALPLINEESVISLFRSRKVLVIDDDPMMRKAISGYLAKHFEVYEAENGEWGLDLAQTVFPEVVICDLNMPVMNGFEFCHKLKNDTATSHIACIVLTGQTERDVEKSAIEAGADEFLTKPYDAYILIKRVTNILQLKDHMRKQFNKEQNYNLKTLAKDKTTQEFLDKCVSYIELHISNNNLHADDLCKELGLSKTLLYEKIKNITGLTVNEFIKVIRLKRSVEYLKEGKLNVSQIAIEVGFNSLSYFTRSFVKQYGKSPSEYLKV